MRRLVILVPTAMIVGACATAQQPGTSMEIVLASDQERTTPPNTSASAPSSAELDRLKLSTLLAAQALQSLLVARAQTAEGQDLRLRLDAQIASLEGELRQLNRETAEVQSTFVVHPAYAPRVGPGSTEAAQALLDNLRFQIILLEKLESIDARLNRLEGKGKK